MMKLYHSVMLVLINVKLGLEASSGWPSGEIPANLPGQFSLSGQIFFALGSSNSEGHRGISKYFFLDHFNHQF